MNKITDQNHIKELSNFSSWKLTEIDKTNIVYEILLIGNCNYVSIRHSQDDDNANAYYEFKTGDMALSSEEFDKLFLENFIKTEILEPADTAEDIVDMLDMLIN